MKRGSMTLLIVDDNYTMLSLLEPMLKKLGYENFITAGNGAEAWRKLNGAEEVHLVLSDLIMPKMDGVEFLCRVRDSEKFWDLPFIMITGEENQDTLMSAIEVDINSYILKPFSHEKLESEITAVLKEKYDPPPYHQLMHKGREMLTFNNDINAAWAFFVKAGEMQPVEADPYYFRAIILDRQGRQAEAVASLEKCIELRESHTKAHDFLALMLHREERYKEEIAVLNRITELSPDNMERHMVMGRAYAMLNDQKAVRASLKKAVGLARRKGRAVDKAFMSRIFETYLQTEGLADDAEGVYRRYIDPRMDQPRLLNRFALLLKAHKSFAAAVCFMERIIHIWRTVKRHGIKPEEMAVYYFNLAVIYVEQGRGQVKGGEARFECYKNARRVIDKSLDCDFQHAAAMKLLDWLDKRLDGYKK